MRATLKGLHSPDIQDLKTYVPEEEDNFGFLLQATVGPTESEGKESFDITVCTPKWLSERNVPSDILLGLHKIIVLKYDYLRLHNFIEKFLMHCSGETWNEVAQKVSLLGKSEFEGYHPRSP